MLDEVGGKQAPGTPPGDINATIKAARELHELALRYWAEGRLDDARRVALEASRLVEGETSASRLRAEISSTLEALTQQ